MSNQHLVIAYIRLAIRKLERNQTAEAKQCLEEAIKTLKEV